MAPTVINLEITSSDESDGFVSRASTPGPDIALPDDVSQTSDQLTDVPIDASAISSAELDFATETAQFLADPSNFIALGSFRGRDDGTGSLEDHWKDVTTDFTGGGLNSEILEHLQNLAAAGWVRIASRLLGDATPSVIYHIYLLRGDVGHRFIARDNRKLKASLELILAHIDVSAATWAGQRSSHVHFDWWATAEEGSLFSKFNELPSPRPDLSAVTDHYVRGAMQDLLEPESLEGIRTPLYPYQRRSAACMLQREAVPNLELDPRLELRTAPDGTLFYYSPREMVLLGKPRYYEACRGGILAESMGLGKTLICLALIAATKYHLPAMPSQSGQPPVRNAVAKLSDMSISAVNRMSIPWRLELERIRAATGEDRPGCVQLLERCPPTYEVPSAAHYRTGRNATTAREFRTLAATTIIVVPRNLCKQWHAEIGKHVDPDYLNILVMEDLGKPLPPADQLRDYDVILFSRNRFEREVKDGADGQNRRLPSGKQICRCSYIGATRTRDCQCIKVDQLYVSPLRHLHVKRLIIDEGHSFSASQSVAVSVANKLVTADHRWVVSGTPAKDLLGIEVEAPGADRDTILAARRSFDPLEDTKGAVESLGSLASNFLKAKPWSADIKRGKSVVWEDLIYRHESTQRRTYSGFSGCLSRTLQSIVIKTRPEDVERDIDLPPFTHETILLRPSLFDKITANLFTLVLTANAVTSERSDADYIFHKDSTSARHHLIANLRQSAFFWTGFSLEDIQGSKKNALQYLEKEGTGASEEDRCLLTEVVAAADQAMSASGWKHLSESHELGLFIDQWPADTSQFWAFAGCEDPMLTGISQALEAQGYVHERAASGVGGLTDGLAGVGVKSLARARNGRAHDSGVLEKQQAGPQRASLPNSSIQDQPSLKRRSSLTEHGRRSSPKKRRLSFNSASNPLSSTPSSSHADANTTLDDGVELRTQCLTSAGPGYIGAALDNTPSSGDSLDGSVLARAHIIGTTSAKLSYLVSQILKHYRDEKILVFYDGDNAAYYIAQMLELLHIQHEIYAKSLSAAMKSEYVVKFNEDPEARVLLMDVKQAAHGLNISSASRVYFVNPVCRPNIEAQAIKRAHRIGQTRHVHVETLVLQGTIEEKMQDRAKRMTGVEHRGASYLDDDGGMRAIIQDAKVIPLMPEDMDDRGQMAPLEVPQQLWGRPGWRDALQTTRRANTSRNNSKGGSADRPSGGVTSPKTQQRTGSQTRDALADVDARTGDDTAVEQENGDVVPPTVIVPHADCGTAFSTVP